MKDNTAERPQDGLQEQLPEGGLLENWFCKYGNIVLKPDEFRILKVAQAHVGERNAQLPENRPDIQ